MADLIIKFSFVPSLVVAGYAWLVYKKLPRELKAFAWFLFLSALAQGLSAVYWFQSKNNMPLLHLYVAGGFVCLALFYERVLDGFIDKKIIRGMGIAFLVFTSCNSLFIQPVLTFNSYALTAESMLVVILSLTTYLVMMEDIVKKRRQEQAQSLNWINSGLLIYYASSLIIFNITNLFFADLSFKIFSKSYNLQTWTLHAFFLFVMNICSFMGLLKRPGRKKPDAFP